MEDKIKIAQKAHYTAVRFVHLFNISGHEAHRIYQRITHLKKLLDELKRPQRARLRLNWGLLGVN